MVHMRMYKDSGVSHEISLEAFLERNEERKRRIADMAEKRKNEEGYAKSRIRHQLALGIRSLFRLIKQQSSLHGAIYRQTEGGVRKAYKT